MKSWNVAIEIEDVWVDWADKEEKKECVFINDIKKSLDLDHEEIYKTIKKCFRCSENESSKE